MADGDPLLNNETATGNVRNWIGGMGMFIACCAGWNGAGVALQVLGPDDVTWMNAGGNTTFVANNLGIFYLPPCRIRAAVSGAVPSAGVFAQVAQVSVR